MGSPASASCNFTENIYEDLDSAILAEINGGNGSLASICSRMEDRAKLLCDKITQSRIHILCESGKIVRSSFDQGIPIFSPVGGRRNS